MPPPNSSLHFGRSFALLWDFVGTVLAGIVIGQIIDRRFGTEPYWSLGLFMVSVVGGFVRLVKSLRQLDRQDHADRAS